MFMRSHGDGSIYGLSRGISVGRKRYCILRKYRHGFAANVPAQSWTDHRCPYSVTVGESSQASTATPSLESLAKSLSSQGAVDPYKLDFNHALLETSKRRGGSEIVKDVANSSTAVPEEYEKDGVGLTPTFNGNQKEIKAFVNRLLRDKGRLSHDWRIPLSLLEQFYRPHEGTHERSLVRTVFNEERNVDPPRAARHVPPPVEWSEESFLQYVEDIARSQTIHFNAPRYLGRQRLKENFQTIAATFLRVFYDDAFRKCLTVKACNTALRFFYKHSMIRAARALYTRMEDLQMKIPQETYHIVLEGSASQHDLHNFTFLLQTMIWRGFRPNEETWAAFLMTIEYDEVRAVILRRMRIGNVLNNISARKKLIALVIKHEAVSHLKNGHSPSNFLKNMDNAYGPGWLSTSAGNQLLNVFGKGDSTMAALRLLPEMRMGGFIPDEVSLNTLLQQCLPSGQQKIDFDLALEILKTYDQQFGRRPGQISYQTLFLQAWKSRLLNLARVAWRSACIDDAVTYQMEKLVVHSLISSAPARDTPSKVSVDAQRQNCSRSKKFNRFAGRFVMGLQNKESVRLDRILAASSPDESPEAKERISWLVRENILRVKRKFSLTGLIRNLHLALVLDRKCAATGLWRRDDMRPALECAISIRDVRYQRFLLRPCKSFKDQTIVPQRGNSDSQSFYWKIRTSPLYRYCPGPKEQKMKEKEERRVKAIRKIWVMRPFRIPVGGDPRLSVIPSISSNQSAPKDVSTPNKTRSKREKKELKAESGRTIRVVAKSIRYPRRMSMASRKKRRIRPRTFPLRRMQTTPIQRENYNPPRIRVMYLGGPCLVRHLRNTRR